jgi:nascent polypeptide-associated complex subunit beta
LVIVFANVYFLLHLFISSITVQASIPSNTYVVSGTVETKKLEELLPGILNQLGPESMGRLRDYATSNMGENGPIEEEDEDDDDDVPDLVENFEEAAAK